MVTLLRFLFFLPGLAIGFIIVSGIDMVDPTTGLLSKVLGAAIGGSITTKLGHLLFLRSLSTAEKGGGVARTMIAILIAAIIAVAGILLAAELGVLHDMRIPFR